ncbi:DUF6973 domain-containing protein [Spongiimicrobium sp. 2-473A-2-J]|uniref:DUF6973 domain-containing protein n=1 Tax=Eudoraea algarum TaxID=3417568 RepID=UPI003D3651D6
MNIKVLVKLVTSKHMGKLLRLCLQHPLFVGPSFMATKKCVKISNKLYGNLHHKNGPENAFRHALWNYLIAKKCYRWRPKTEKILFWTAAITHLHELFSPNSELAKAMDLHNNKVGRELFLANMDKEIAEVVLLLEEMTLASQKVTELGEIRQYGTKLIHIVEV